MIRSAQCAYAALFAKNTRVRVSRWSSRLTCVTRLGRVAADAAHDDGAAAAIRMRCSTRRFDAEFAAAFLFRCLRRFTALFFIFFMPMH